jgi:hypothetical protein
MKLHLCTQDPCPIQEKEIKDILEMAHKLYYSEVEYYCNICKDTGYITKTEWTGTDQSYEVEVKCICTEI